MKDLFYFLYFLFKGALMLSLFYAVPFAVGYLFRFEEAFSYDYNLHKFEIFILSLVIIYINYNHWTILMKEDEIQEERNRRESTEKECKERTERVNACVEHMKEMIRKELPEPTSHKINWMSSDTYDLKRGFDLCFDIVKEKRKQYAFMLNNLQETVDVITSKVAKEVGLKIDIPSERTDVIENFKVWFNVYFSALKLKQKEIEIEKSTLRQILQSSFPFDKVASLCADAETAIFDIERRHMLTKTRPAISSAEKVRDLKLIAKEHVTAYKVMLYKYEFLLKQFPELDKYVEDYETIKSITSNENLSEAMESYDRTKDWISKEEYRALSANERNQLALDRYVNSGKKSKWQIGRDYELYVGHLFRKEGWNVIQFGIEKKLKDMGRDLIVSKTRKDGLLDIRVVQCKIWSRDKEIHENAICQLFGTTVQYIIEQNMIFKDVNERVRPLFVTTTELSETASKFAKTLGVQIRTLPLGDFPRIKCNISKTGEKIYHLPFDQQYDTTVIDYSSGEFYAFSVEEAVSKGFRRAFRHHNH